LAVATQERVTARTASEAGVAQFANTASFATVALTAESAALAHFAFVALDARAAEFACRRKGAVPLPPRKL